MKVLHKSVLATALAVAAVGPAMATGTLLPDGMLNTPGDLTRIQINPSTVLEFLDLNVTQGSTVASAVSAYSGAGFHWATGAEVSDLLSAFGITYAAIPNGVAILGGAGLAQRTAFVNHVGDTYDGFGLSLGWLDALTTATSHSYSCIAINQCNGNSFINNTTSYWPSEPHIGVFLVRAVPEPATFLLLAVGIAAMLNARRVRIGRP